MNNNGMLVVVSAPSGCGKDTVFKEIRKKRNDIVESVSATTRKPREGEVEGVNYFFLSEDEFKDLIENNGLLEYAVYNNCYYGTPIKGVNDAISNGKICVLVIDVQGAENVKKLYPDSVSIFLVPPSWETLEQRLRARNSEEEEMIQKRLDIAKKELLCQDEYDYKVEKSKEKREYINNYFFFDSDSDFVIAENVIVSPWIEYVLQCLPIHLCG